MFGWQGYVPRRTGASRMVLEASLLVPPFVAVGVGWLAREGGCERSLADASPAQDGRVIAATRSSASSRWSSVGRYDVRLAPSRDERSDVAVASGETSDVVLGERVHRGVHPDVTAAQGLLDGRAPYTFGGLIDRATRLLRGAQAFFGDPAANWDFLADEQRLVGRRRRPATRGARHGNIWQTPTRSAGLEGCTGLERVVQQSAVTVFRVVDSGLGGCGPGHG